ncbi:MAG: hypothetical protein QOF70_6862, partial [Acetobacteraceae bacterium]|nr:hypothetical protein [Acetobacteraceae bacterium]
LVSALPHAAGGTVPNIALSFRLSGTPLADPVAAPTLGQHSREVLRDLLGYSPAEIDALAQRGVIHQPNDAQSR